MIDCPALATMVELQGPASDEALMHTQVVMGVTFPASYIALLKCSDGFSVPDVVSLLIYGTHELPERNTTYEVTIYLPEWILIGSDGGGRGIFLDHTNQKGAIYRADLGAMFPEDAELLASHVAEWIARRFSLDPLS